MNYSADINGITVNATYSDTTVNEVFIPLLKHLAQLHHEKQRRILAMLAAPPATGKSTLVSFLEHPARSVIPEKRLQAVGMDGFHLRQEYLLTHTVDVDGKSVPMASIKGAPITFDPDALTRKISEVTEGNSCRWPHYDRQLHDPADDAITIDAEIVLIEGNYLLLDADGWRDLPIRGLHDLAHSRRGNAAKAADPQEDENRDDTGGREALRRIQRYAKRAPVP